MSDEFIAIATQEINDEIAEIDSTLKLCTGDEQVYENSKKFQTHTHKIKGLAPMMGKEALGTVCVGLDLIMKKIIDGKKPEGIHEILLEALPQMKNSMNEPNCDLSKITEKISNLASTISE